MPYKYHPIQLLLNYNHLLTGIRNPQTAYLIPNRMSNIGMLTVLEIYISAPEHTTWRGNADTTRHDGELSPPTKSLITPFAGKSYPEDEVYMFRQDEKNKSLCGRMKLESNVDAKSTGLAT